MHCKMPQSKAQVSLSHYNLSRLAKELRDKTYSAK